MKIDLKKNAEQYKFCFRCGGEFSWKGNKLIVCQKCGLNYFLATYATNGAILENNSDEILLVERKNEPKKGFWDLPGGFVDFNENLEESMARELEEELKVKIDNLKYFCSEYDSYTYDEINFPTIGFIFVGKIDDQKITPMDDVASYKFFRPEDIPFETVAFEGLKNALKKYIKSLK